MEMVYRDWTWAEGTSELHEWVAQIPWALLLLRCLLSPRLHWCSHGESPPSVISWQRKRNLGLVDRWFCERKQLKHHSLFRIHAWRKILPVIRTLGSVPGCSLCLVEERPEVQLYTEAWPSCGQWFGWMVRDLEGEWLENGWQGNLGERYVNKSLWMGKTMKTFVSYVNVHQRVTSQRRILIIEWIGGWPIHWTGQPTPMFVPEESQGQGSLVGCRLWGHTESDMTEAT